MVRGAAVLCAVIIAINVLSCGPREPRPGTVQDEAMRAGVAPEKLVLPTTDYFHDMGRKRERVLHPAAVFIRKFGFDLGAAESFPVAVIEFAESIARHHLEAMDEGAAMRRTPRGRS